MICLTRFHLTERRSKGHPLITCEHPKKANNYNACEDARPTNASHDALQGITVPCCIMLITASCQDQLIDNAEMYDLLTPAIGFIQGPTPFFKDSNTRQ